MVERALICGMGSIGRRHLRHLRALGVEHVDAYRTGKATMPEDPGAAPDREFRDLDEALAEQPAVVVVANPTSLHVPTALAAVRAGCHVLVEKPLGATLDGVETLAAEAAERGVVASVACNMRFHPALALLRSWAQDGGPLGRPLHARAHFGTYLPDWHPWEDYRRSYAGRRELGGGATLTHVHEIDYSLWLFGDATLVAGMAMERTPLGTDVDEASALVLGHVSGVLTSITLSLVQKPASRGVDIAFERGVATANLLSGVVHRYTADGEVERIDPPAGFDIDDTYRDQARSFLEAVRDGGRPAVTLEDGIAALRVALAGLGR